jgi:hypothetical protein
MKVDVLSFSPEKMNLKDMRRVPEERITATLGIPAIVVGLGAGLDRSTFANYAEARESAYESFIIPNQRRFAADLKSQLLPDFGDTAGVAIQFDTSGVRVLQEDENAKAQRWINLVNGGLAMVSEGRNAVGLPVEPEHDVFLRPANLIETGPGAEPAPEVIVENTPPALPAPQKALKHGRHNQRTHGNRYGKGFSKTKEHFRGLSKDDRERFKGEARRRRDASPSGMTFGKGDLVFPNGKKEYRSIVVGQNDDGYVVRVADSRPGTWTWGKDMWLPFNQAHAPSGRDAYSRIPTENQNW